ncbi:hypothetical protein MY4038_009125 [Beauveria bassiana]
MAASDAAPSSLATDPILYNEYMASLVPPTKERFHEIAQIQMEKESENRRKMKEQQRLSTDPTLLPEDQQGQDAAARVIQKTFRGYRARREMDGYSINPSTRWVAAVRDAQFRETHRPRPRALSEAASVSGEVRPPSASARHNWRKAGMVAFRAGRDASDSESDSGLGSPDSPDAASPEAKAAKRQQRQVENAKRRAEARTMGLQYFLEMIDAKHRYGSNLRIYHEEWKRSDAQENFLYWLDYGAGRNVELDACPREQLEREQVRYLSREERQYYLVKVDAEGRLCWAKNGARIDTTEQFKDSINGIVPADDTTPAFRPSANPLAGTSGSDSDSSIESRREADRANKYATPEFDNASGVKKIHHLSTSTIINKLLRKSVRPNCWIFVADTNFRLYVGIKDSGAFQHSSFLQGGRISAAGLIKIKNGRLQSLSPLSGHYRPPSSNFRAFLQSLKAENVDMGHLTVSKSYAVLVGLEAYVKTTKKSKNFVNKLLRTRDKAADTKPAQMAMKKLSITREKRQPRCLLGRIRINRSLTSMVLRQAVRDLFDEKEKKTGTSLRRKKSHQPSVAHDLCQVRCQAAAILSMASVTRSTRRPEVFPPPHLNGHAPMARATPALFHHPPPQQQPQARRTKRAIEATGHDFATVNTKKTRIAVEIVARPSAAPPPPQKVQPPLPTPPQQPVAVAAAPAALCATPPEANLDVTRHKAKVINGIKHELDRLQPDMAGTKDPGREPGRKLRSQEATRFKSDLSAYFPDYDEVIGNEPKEQHLLNLDTPIIIVDSGSRRLPQAGLSQPQMDIFPVRGYGDALYTDVFDAQQIDFGFLEAQYKNRALEDPLPDSTFEPIHRRAERVERSIRNSEKGRAQHEKDQIIRLLEGLQGHDWLRVMGVSGITETKKKTFEPARAHFIKGCQGIIDKFKNWSLEEKRRKQERERTLAAEHAQEELKEVQDIADAEDEEMDDVNDNTPTHQSRSEDGRGIDEEDEDALMNSQDNSSEASSSSPAKQLRQEAMARSKMTAKRPRSDTVAITPRQSETPKEFKSFFSKKYERDGALNKHRRAGRNILAWGHPIPDIAEMDFDLPEDYRDDELLKARARKRRRDKRSKP